MDCGKTVAKSGTPIKILIGGSPCTKWSIAQKNGREVLQEGRGWELFENYRIAKEKFQPDIFLYENNKSAAQPIKDAIYSALGGGKDSSVRLTHIDSALVSAQHRQRFYVTNFGDIEQPKDRGILLKDVLESGRDLTSNDKSFALTATYDGAIAQNTLEQHQRSMVAKPIEFRVRNGSEIRVTKNNIHGRQKNGAPEAESFVCFEDGKANTLTTAHISKCICKTDGKVCPIYEVKDGQITIKDKRYPIKLQDGYYIIRKLTPTECERLQTMPDGYTAAVSNSQRYKALGNGWTAEVIIHILNHALKDVPRDKELVVLSMYDGIATGRYCLDKMGFTNVKYYAYEIDPYAQKIAMSNYPDIVQCGDAFQVREDGWKIPI